MLSFLFWNLKNSPPKDTLRRLVLRHNVDVLMLAECPMNPQFVLAELNQSGTTTFYYNTKILNPGNPVHIYSRFGDEYVSQIQDGHGYTFRRLNPPGRMDILLAIVHLRSKLYNTGVNQTIELIEFSRELQAAERNLSHQRTVLVGDFNVNPFEAGMIAAGALNAVMDRRTAGREDRERKDKSYPFFYNPMWGLFGDGTRGPPGTIYRTDSNHDCYYWNIFDQVLIRPTLLDRFKNEDLHIVEDDGVQKFRSAEGLPKGEEFSDHLPIVFKLDV